MQKNVLTCSITIPRSYKQDKQIVYNTDTFPFFLDSDFGFSLANDWKELHSGLKDLPFLQGLANTVSAVTGQAQVTFQSQSMSSVSWNGSTFGGFDLSCLFICTNRRINPVVAIESLARSCLPMRLDEYPGEKPAVLNHGQSAITAVSDLTFSGIEAMTPEKHKNAVSDLAQSSRNFIKDVGLVAPLGYGIMLNSDQGRGLEPIPGTTLSFQIGDWFRATDLVVESISGIQFSKELVGPTIKDGTRGPNDLYNSQPEYHDYGFPLYAKCNIRLKPYTLVDYDTFAGYFISRTQNSLNKINNVHNTFTLPSL
jgi:hypothetical protein